MSQDEDTAYGRKGKLSAFSLLKSWLFSKSETAQAKHETEFLNTKDGYELASFAKKAFGGDAEAKRAHEEAVAAEQAEIDALLKGTDVVPIQHQHPASPVVAAVPKPAPAPAVAAVPARAPAPAPAPAPPPAAAPSAAAAAAAAASLSATISGVEALTPKERVDLAVRYLERLREQGLTVETLAEALIVIESREVRRRASEGNG